MTRIQGHRRAIAATPSAGDGAAAVPGGLTSILRRGSGRLPRPSLGLRFAAVCLVVLVLGALIIGELISREIERGVIARTGDVTALYVDSFVSPHLTGLSTGEGISGEDADTLGALLTKTPLGQQIVSFKVWSVDGDVVFSTHPEQIGQRYPVEEDLRDAMEGKITSELSHLDAVENVFEREHWPHLVETYTPYFGPDGGIHGAVEFYQLPDELLAQVRDSQEKGWVIVGASTIAMYVLLVGLVGGASRTIERQTRNLHNAFVRQLGLEERIRNLNVRLRRAAEAKAETDESLLQRISRDLHDGPAQDLAFALLRFDTVRGRADEDSETLEAAHISVRHALDDIRSITTTLHLPQLQGKSWTETIDLAVADHRRRTPSRVNVNAAEPEQSPTQPQRIAVYRVVQEALNNAAEHSGAGEQWVTLNRDGQNCVIEVKDEGAGFDAATVRHKAERRPRLGLDSMRERIELLGGELIIASRPGRGTTVTARIPLAVVE